MKKLYSLLVASFCLLLSTYAQVIFDPATYDASGNADQEVVTIDGESYLKIALNGYSNSFNIDPVTIDHSQATQFATTIKYAVGTSGYTLGQINTIVQIMNSGWSTMGSRTKSSKTTFQGFTNWITEDAASIVQVYGQQTSSWGAVTGDTIWIGKIEVAYQDPNVLFDPEFAYKYNDYPSNIGYEEIDGIGYAKITSGNYPNFSINKYTITSDISSVVAPVIYEVKDGAAYDSTDAKVYFKIVDNSSYAWTELGAGTSNITGSIQNCKANVSTGKVTNIQLASQLISDGTLLYNDTIYLGPVYGTPYDTMALINPMEIASWQLSNITTSLDDKEQVLEMTMNAWNNNVSSLDYNFKDTKYLEVEAKYELASGSTYNMDDLYIEIYVKTSDWATTLAEFSVKAQSDYQKIYIPNTYTGNAGVVQFTIRDANWSFLSEGKLYVKKITAYDDSEAPSAIANLVATVDTSAVNLTWDASTDNNTAVSYLIYQDGVKIDSISTNSYDVTELDNGIYTFGVVAVDTNSNYTEMSTVDATIRVISNTFKFKNVLAGTVADASDFSGNAAIVWDVDSLYITISVKDNDISTSDTVAVYFDMDNSKNVIWPRNYTDSSVYDANDFELIVVPGTDFSANNDITGVYQEYSATDTTYLFKLHIPVDSLMIGFNAAVGTQFGVDGMVMDKDADQAVKKVSLFSKMDNLANDPSLFGTLELSDNGSFTRIADATDPAFDVAPSATVDNSSVTLSWSATDNIAVLSYAVYMNDELLQDNIYAEKDGNSIEISDLENGIYELSVQVVDNSGNMTQATPTTAQIKIFSTSINVEKIVAGAVDNETDFKCVVDATYDTNNIYFNIDVTDDSIYIGASNIWDRDNIEIYLDMDNSKNIHWPRNGGWVANDATFDDNDYQLRLVPESEFITPSQGSFSSATVAYSVTEAGYNFDVAIPWSTLMTGFEPTVGAEIGFDILASDNDNDGTGRNQITYNAPTEFPYNDPSLFGTIKLASGYAFELIEDTEAPQAPANVVATASGSTVTLTWDVASDNIATFYYNIYQGTDLIEGTLYGLESGNSYSVEGLEPGDYTFAIEAVDNSGNVSTKGSASVTIVSINDVNASALKLFPNPATETLTISGVDNIQSIEIYNMNGSLIYTNNKVNSTTLNVENMNQGVYLIKVTTLSDVFTQRFSKK